MLCSFLSTKAERLISIAGDNIYEIDKETAEVSLVAANIGVKDVSEITYVPSRKRVYGIADFKNTPKLFYFSICDFQVNVVGNLIQKPIEGEAQLTIGVSESLAYSEKEDKIYISYGESSPYSTILGVLDPETAEITPIASFSNTLQNEADRITFINDTLYTIDGSGSQAGRVYITSVIDATNDYVNTPLPSIGSTKQSKEGTIYSVGVSGNLYIVESDFSLTEFVGAIEGDGEELHYKIAFVESPEDQIGKLIGLAGPYVLDIDPLNGKAKEIGKLDFSTPANLAYDSQEKRLFVVNNTSSAFILNELNSCYEPSVIDTIKFENGDPVVQAEGMAFNYIDDKFYMAAGTDHVWYSDTYCELDPNNAVLKRVSSISNNVHNEIDDMEFVNGMVYYIDGTNELTGGLYTFNTSTYESEEIKKPANPHYVTFAYDSYSDIFYGVENNQLYTIDRSSGNGNLIGTIFESVDYKGYKLYNMEFLARPIEVTAINFQENEKDINVEVFPNPVKSTLFVNAKFNVENYLIIDLSGRVVDSGIVGNVRDFKINTEKFLPGFYTLVLKNSNSNKSMSFIVK